MNRAPPVSDSQFPGGIAPLHLQLCPVSMQSNLNPDRARRGPQRLGDWETGDERLLALDSLTLLQSHNALGGLDLVLGTGTDQKQIRQS
jgi:hypothetical protein